MKFKTKLNEDNIFPIAAFLFLVSWIVLSFILLVIINLTLTGGEHYILPNGYKEDGFMISWAPFFSVFLSLSFVIYFRKRLLCFIFQILDKKDVTYKEFQKLK